MILQVLAGFGGFFSPEKGAENLMVSSTFVVFCDVF